MNTLPAARTSCDPYPAETVLEQAFAAGARADLRGETSAAARTVRAAALAALLRGARGPAAAAGRATPALWLRGARVIGRLDLTGGGVAPEILRIRFEECEFDEPLVCTDAVLPGLALTGCRAPAIEADRIRVQGPLELRRCTVPAGVRLERARAETDVLLTGSTLGPGPEGRALAAEGLAVGGALDLSGTVASGAVYLAGVRVAGPVRLDDADVRAPGGDALTLDRAVLGDRLLARRLVVEGGLRMFNADVAGSVRLTGARLSHPGGIALGASGATVRGALWCTAPFTASGEVRLTGAELRTRLDLSGARIGHPGALTALSLDRLSASDVCLRGLTVTRGTVTAEGIHVRDTLDLRIDRADELKVDQGTVGVLLDGPTHWPARAGLAGLSYRALHPVLPAAERLRWLARDPSAEAAAQPYEQLAQHYTALGRPLDARKVRFAAQRRHRAALSGPARWWEGVLQATVGYGFRPWRALGWLAALVVLGAVVFGAVPPTALEPEKAPRFHAAAYTLDLLLPLVNLGQETAYQPGGATTWFGYALVGIGWVLASAVALGLGRSLSRS
ncbi:oxidoreductase [Streptomyces yangpuensis]|uniref:oxidoreductase n=1 Tax=Streptomyces yangpuensis TaxID=1648182 RepID=UPI003715C6B5